MHFRQASVKYTVTNKVKIHFVTTRPLPRMQTL